MLLDADSGRLINTSIFSFFFGSQDNCASAYIVWYNFSLQYSVTSPVVVYGLSVSVGYCI